MLAFVVLLGIAYVLPGLVGHDPWKPDEAYSFGMIYHILNAGDWVVPMVAGEPFMEKPPLYYVSAAYMAKLLFSWMPLHDAARLTSGIYTAVTLALVGLSARANWGDGHGSLAVMILLGSLGLVTHSHMMYTDTALLTGFALAFYGLILSRTQVVVAGLALGTGVGMGFMSKGLIAVGMIGCIAVLLPVFAAWRNRAYLRCLMVALIAAAPWLTIWPFALYQRSPELFMQWFWINNIGRFFGFAHLGASTEPWFCAETLLWFAFPALPLALWTAWQLKWEELKQPAFQLPALAFVVMVTILGVSRSARAVYMLPLLLPLSVLAAGGARSLPRRFAATADWLCRVVFGLLAVALWWCWIEMALQGRPPEWAWLAAYLPMDFKPVFQGAALAVAVALTLAWALLLYTLNKWNIRPVISWVAGLTLVWGLLLTLWLPWLDSAKSYREVFASMQRALPLGSGCVASLHLGESERAMLEYMAGVVSVRREIEADAACDLILVQSRNGTQEQASEHGWRLIWEGNRPGDSREGFRLFAREPLARARLDGDSSQIE